MWLFADRDAFAAALDAGTFKEDLHVWADSISPSMLPAAGRRIADVIKASFAPAEDGEKKKKATGQANRELFGCGLVADPGGFALLRVWMEP